MAMDYVIVTNTLIIKSHTCVMFYVANKKFCFPSLQLEKSYVMAVSFRGQRHSLSD